MQSELKLDFTEALQQLFQFFPRPRMEEVSLGLRSLYQEAAGRHVYWTEPQLRWYAGSQHTAPAPEVQDDGFRG